MEVPLAEGQRPFAGINNTGLRAHCLRLVGASFRLSAACFALLTWDFNRRPEPGQQIGSNSELSTTATPQTPVRPNAKKPLPLREGLCAAGCVTYRRP